MYRVSSTHAPLFVSPWQLQELIAVADADGIVRTYRPTPQGNARDNLGTALQEKPATNDAAVGKTQARPFDLVVECRLGARPALCEFAWIGGDEGGAEKSSQHREVHRPEGEVLRTCTVDGNLRVWPTASLPTRPVKPPTTPEPALPGGNDEALAPLPVPQPSSNATTYTSGGGGGGGGGGDGINTINRPPVVAWREQENMDPSGPFSRLASENDDAKGQRVGVGAVDVDVDGDVGVGVGREEEKDQEEPAARGEPPLPKPRPAAPRRVSFAQADQV